MRLENGEEVIDAPAQKTENRLIRGWSKRTLKTVRGHVARELVIVPKHPSQDLEPVVVGISPIIFIARRQPQQDRPRLGEPNPLSSSTGISPIALTRAIIRSRNATAKVRPYRFEGLATEREHQRKLVAVA